MQQSGLLKLLAPLLKSGLPLLKSLIKLLSMFRLTAAASATDAIINKEILGSGNHTKLITSNDDLNDLLEVIKSLEENGIFLDGITETIKDEEVKKLKKKLKNKKEDFLVCYLVHLVQVY